MKHKLAVKGGRTFDVKATDSEDGIQGYVRMGGKKGNTFSRGICGEFLVPSDGSVIYFDSNNLFFYGHTGDLSRNYNLSRRHRKRTIPEGLASRLDEYFDKGFAQGTVDTRGDLDVGFLKIPYEDLRLGTTQQEIVKGVVAQAGEILPDLVRSLVREQIDTSDPQTNERVASARAELERRYQNTPVETLEFSVRTLTCLKWRGVEDVSQLILMTERDLAKTRNFGSKSLKEVKKVLDDLGLSLAEE